MTQGDEAGEGLTAVMRGHPGGANLLAFRSTFNSEVRRGQRGGMSVHLPLPPPFQIRCDKQSWAKDDWL